MNQWLEIYLVGVVAVGLFFTIKHRDFKSAWIGLIWPVFITIGIGFLYFGTLHTADKWSASNVKWKRWAGTAALWFFIALIILSSVFRDD